MFCYGNGCLLLFQPRSVVLFRFSFLFFSLQYLFLCSHRRFLCHANPVERQRPMLFTTSVSYPDAPSTLHSSWLCSLHEPCHNPSTGEDVNDTPVLLCFAFLFIVFAYGFLFFYEFSILFFRLLAYNEACLCLESQVIRLFLNILASSVSASVKPVA